MNTAETIRAQIGPQALRCAGARNLVASDYALTFRLNVDKDGFMAARRGKFYITVTLDPSDTYSVRFYQAVGVKVTDIKTFDGVYCDMLSGIVDSAAQGQYTDKK